MGTPEQWQRVKELFHSALERMPEERASYLEARCRGDEGLRREVESLIAAHEREGRFIDTPAYEAVAELLTGNGSASLVPGQTLGRYQVLSLLGVGGMGEVYRARDLRLGREVAIKVLPSVFSSDSGRLLRFEREARTASALNHPNVCTIHEVGETEEGRHYLVMEYVEGITLGEKIHREKTPLPKLLRYLQQAAEGLAKAHAAGIVHRDLKPDNIMVTRDGRAKVLDFGLAKLIERPMPNKGEGEHPSEAETVALPQHSAPGLILGTAGYMSPEQAQGRTQEIDHRSDVFSFGCILYEAVTEHQPFAADSLIKSLHKVIYETAAPIREFNPAAPPELQRIVKRCLAKDPEERYQSIKDVAIELKELRRELEGASEIDTTVPPNAAGVETPGRSAGGQTGETGLTSSAGGASTKDALKTRPTSSAEYIVSEIRRRRRGAAITLMMVVLAAAGSFFAWYRWGGRPQTTAGGPAPRLVPFTTYLGAETWPSFSPDGNQIAFSWSGEKEDNFDVYVKLVGAGSPLRLTSNPADDTVPIFSPDGRYVAFQRTTPERAALYLVPSLGGPERKLSDIFPGLARPMSYTPDGKFLAVSDKGSAEEPFAIHFIPVAAGERRRLTTPPAGSVGDGSPAISPDGQWMAFIRSVGSGVFDLYVMPAAGGDVRRLTFDRTSMWFGAGGFSSAVSWTVDSREIIFSSWRGGSIPHLWRVGASGGEPVRVEEVESLAASPAVSPRGGRLAYTQIYNDLNVWRVAVGEDGRAGLPTMLISSTLADDSPAYSPDGQMIAFTSTRSGSYEIWVCDADGTNAVQLTNFGGPLTGTPRWSPDGRWIAFDTRVEGNPDIFVISSEGGQPRRLTTEASEDVVPSWSRDGRFIYFASNRSGSLQVWKMPAEGGEARQVTKNGGFEGYESADGEYFYYQKTRQQTVPGIWRVPAEGGEETLLFDRQRAGIWRAFTVTEKGIYFVGGESPRQTVIAFYSFSSGEVKEIFRPGKEVPIGILGVSVSPDGKWLLYTQADQYGRDVMLVENFR